MQIKQRVQFLCVCVFLSPLGEEKTREIRGSAMIPDLYSHSNNVPRYKRQICR